MAKVFQRPQTTVWWCRFRIQGKEIRKSTGETDYERACLRASQIEIEMEGPNLRISEAAKRYDQTVKSVRETTKAVYASAYRRIMSFSDAKLCVIDENWLRKYVAHRINSKAGQVSVRLELSALSSLLNHSMLWPDSGVTRNPVKGFPRTGLAQIRKRVRWLTDAQREHLLRETPEGWKRNLLILALETGMRIGEMRQLRWKHVFLADEKLVLTADITKTNRGRTIPLSPEAVRVLCAQEGTRHHTSTYVFHVGGQMVGDCRSWWRGLRKRVGLEDFRIHDLRHTFASRWVQKGGREDILRQILGHTTVSMTARYAHLREDDLRTELLRVQQYAPVREKN